MRLGKLMNTIKDFACAGEINLRMRYPLPLPLDSKDPVFCSLITNKVDFTKSSSGMIATDCQSESTQSLGFSVNGFISLWFFYYVVCKNVKNCHGNMTFYLFFYCSILHGNLGAFHSLA